MPTIAGCWPSSATCIPERRHYRSQRAGVPACTAVFAAEAAIGWILAADIRSRGNLRGRYPRDVSKMFHVTSVANRDSILRYGLDWSRMGAAPGIAGSRAQEAEGVFLASDEFEADWFVGNGSGYFYSGAGQPRCRACIRTP